MRKNKRYQIIGQIRREIKLRIIEEIEKESDKQFLHELVHGSPTVGIMKETDEMKLMAKSKPHLGNLGFSRKTDLIFGL